MEFMAFDEDTEACMELAALPSSHIIVRSQLEAAMQRHKDLIEGGNAKKKFTLDKLKEKQVAWRRKHDALVRRKRFLAAKFRPVAAPTRRKSFDSVSNKQASPSSRSRAHAESENTDLAFSSEDPKTPSKCVFIADNLESKSLSRSSSFSGLSVSDGEHEQTSPSSSKQSNIYILGSTGEKFANATTCGNPQTAPGSLAPSRRGSTTSIAPPKQRRSSHDAFARTTSMKLSALRAGSRTFERSNSKIPVPNDAEVVDAALGVKIKETFGFDSVMTLARRHNMRVEDVKKKWEQFHTFDVNGDVVLSIQEFKKVIRHMCGIPDKDPIPNHLFAAMWSATDLDNDGQISFEEFLLWSTGVQYSEEMLVPDPEERMLRSIAREHKLELANVERLKGPYDKHDVDHTGLMEHQFHELVCELLHRKSEDFSDQRMRRHWKEVNPEGGKLGFREFAVWWNHTFNEKGELHKSKSGHLGGSLHLPHGDAIMSRRSSAAKI